MGWDDHSRRGVLRGLGAGMVASAIPSAAFARPDPGRKFGYAVVGLGNYAVNQIMPRLALCEHSRLVALVSGTPAKLEKYGAQYNIPTTHRYSYANYDAIRDNPDIDAVYVILPNSMHAEYSVRASKAGKHVMCEKPMANTPEECRQMIAAAKAAGKKLMIGYRCHFEAHNLHCVEAIKAGSFGKIRLITAEHGFDAAPGQWRLDRPLSGGGSLMDIGIYSLNAARYLAGEEPIRVSATESTDRSDPRFKNVEDRIDFQLLFPSGAIANCVSSYSSGHNAFRATGNKGWIGMEPATPYQGHRIFQRLAGKTEEVPLEVEPNHQWVRQMDHLAECAWSGAEPRAGGDEGLRDMLLIEAIYRSAREGRAIEVGG
ncbi:Gfo/Idh/MocA family oxidoreductase [Sphingomonas sp.]|uniref:Gfo/Idh/MocA family protein n=1 Tax=Sphingomonas sp. TaxID=28214 RepID=UPI001B16E14E|nr:Gfo/Idh/MocA family oxidoreductase [Sphingomonas sp.]MBO9714518.1 Gfo/Idh/MocA family oxidoreductase [Sphingomonas sp.]